MSDQPFLTTQARPLNLLLLLLLLSRFSHVQLCAIPQTAAHQAPPSLGFSRHKHWSGLPFPSPMRESEIAQSCPTVSDPMDCMQPTRLLGPWDFPGKRTGVGCHCLLRLNLLQLSKPWYLSTSPHPSIFQLGRYYLMSSNQTPPSV